MSNRFTKEKTSSVGGVSSVFGRSGNVLAVVGDYNTSLIPETSNLYFTNARAVTALTGQDISIFNNDVGYVDASSFIDNEIVSGSGTTFTLANTPITGSVHLWGNGTRLTPTVDYNITGTGISILIGSYVAGSLIADYRE